MDRLVVFLVARIKITIKKKKDNTFFLPVDRLVVILVAQVFNGCLLPFFSICLLLCINDEQFMGR